MTNRVVSKEAKTFVVDWIMTGAEGKTQDYYDIWAIVLANYMPQSFPVLFRSSKTFNEGKIESYTGRLYCAERMAGDGDLLLIIDTKQISFLRENESPGVYSHSFYPLAELLKKERQSSKTHFTSRFIDNYMGEDEYIMRTSGAFMTVCKRIELD